MCPSRWNMIYKLVVIGTLNHTVHYMIELHSYIDDHKLEDPGNADLLRDHTSSLSKNYRRLV